MENKIRGWLCAKVSRLQPGLLRSYLLSAFAPLTEEDREELRTY